MRKSNPVLLLSMALLALSVGVGAGFAVFTFYQKADNADLNWNLPVVSTSKQTYETVTYHVGQKFSSGTNNFEIYFPSDSTSPNTSLTTVKKTLTSRYLPMGSQAEIGTPIAYRYRNNQYTLNTSFSFAGWTTIKTTKTKAEVVYPGYDYDPTVTHELKEYVSDGYNLNSRQTDDTEDSKNLNLYPVFINTELSPIAVCETGNVNIPKVKETMMGTVVEAYHLVNASNVSSISITKDKVSYFSINLTELTSPVIPLDLYLTFSDKQSSTSISGLDSDYECINNTFRNGTTTQYVSIYYKKS